MIRVIQIVDTLRIGGAERMAVNIANGLTEFDIESHICATREEGKLKGAINRGVSCLSLRKKSALDLKAIIRLISYVKKNKINVIHAHGTSFFIAVLVKFFVRNIHLAWHDHFGNRVRDTNLFRLMILKFCSLSFDIIYCVNNELRDWAIKNLYCKKVKFILNFPTENLKTETKLKGIEGKRIVCVANLRAPKNHLLLFTVFLELKEKYPDWSLHCVGSIYGDEYSKNLENFIEQNELERHVFLYGAKEDVSYIISQSTIGVLSSVYEGLPMALLEYGLGGLPVIATDVGYCKNLILDNSYGILVKSNDKDALHSGLELYITNVDYRNECTQNFNRMIISEFSKEKILNTLINDYELVSEKM
ncbi:glycosyl transferase, group 1 family protein [Flavobacteriales bacterium ALC-1]|nr:glycosyl transferase, group 1 family protein [Flavobacteriales bacterium ALC-1]